MIATTQTTDTATTDTPTGTGVPTSAIHLEGTRFGAIAYDPADTITFSEGIIGFEGAHRFVTISAGERSPFLWLQSLDLPELAFLLADPDAFAPQYAPELPAGALATLGIASEAPYLLWTTANVPAGRPRDATLNLAAPIVVNPISRRGAQIVLDGDAYNIRYRAFPASDPASEEGKAWKSERRDPAPLAA
ncbi:flagellar assembly protein FliW [bacterium]|nr:MAG: flagellar assembly protein FliW [bacterium]